MSSAQNWDDVTFRPASPSDADLLTDLAIRSKAHWGYPKEWLDEWRQELTISPSYIQQNSLSIAYRQSQLVGFFGLEFPNASSARLLFEHACATAKNRGCHTLELVADPNAEQFYLHMGAIRIAAERSDILGVARILPKMIYQL